VVVSAEARYIGLNENGKSDESVMRVSLRPVKAESASEAPTAHDICCVFGRWIYCTGRLFMPQTMGSKCENINIWLLSHLFLDDCPYQPFIGRYLDMMKKNDE
jgi:hypothetical protein